MNADDYSVDELGRMLEEEQSAYEEQRMRCAVNTREAFKERTDRLRYILNDYREYIEHIAKRNPDAPLSPFQIMMVNDLLRNCQEILKGREGADYLKTAEQYATYGEMAFLLTPYNTMLWNMAIGKGE